mgnify:CR=1 FL=1
MAQDTAAWAQARASGGGVNRTALWAVLAGWVALALVAALLLLPGKYTAAVDLGFDLATQPPAPAVRGMVQVLSSREMAYAALNRLSPEQVADLGRDTPLPDRLNVGGEGSTQDRAAARLAADLGVAARQGGRVLRLSFTAPSPSLSSAVVRAYLSALGALQDGVPARAEDGQPLPHLTATTSLMAAVGRDLPSRPVLIALGAGIALLAAASFAMLARRPETGAADAPSLPALTDSLPRVAWLDGGDRTAIEASEAGRRLAAHIADAKDRAEKQLVVVTSDSPTRAAGLCAIDLARHLSNENRVALVALDGASGDLAALISDPWAPGMAEMLFGVAGFGETIHRDPHSRAHVIPPGRDSRTGASVIGAERLGLILTALRQTYDFVIVAAPVLDAATGSARLAHLSPYVVCVDPREEEASVEPYAALASQGFGHVLMVRIAQGQPAERALRLVHSTPSLSAA